LTWLDFSRPIFRDEKSVPSTSHKMGVLSDAKARASRLCVPSDDSMYKPMSHNVGDHYSKPRAASAPPERPHGSGTLHLHRFEGLITLPQKRHKKRQKIRMLC
jgi:hypothetical protein